MLVPRRFPKLKLLDLFCSAGGTSRGYQMAGFHVTGVDIKPQPRFAGDVFIQGDALGYLGAHGHEYDCIAASPPCQSYSKAMRHLAASQPMLIGPTRALLQYFERVYGVVWAIENVVGAPLMADSKKHDTYCVELCGTSFGLRVRRHRLFESSVPVPALGCNHIALAMNPHNQAGRDLIYAEFGRSNPEAIWRNEMGVEWMNGYEGREAIPPVMTQYIGYHLQRYLRNR